jgi:chorismate dehydratase
MRPRIGHIQFLNCLPLYYMLVKKGVVLDIDLYKDTPAQLCERLVSGRLDISPVPSIEFARHARDLLLLPGIAVSSRGPVMSIILASKVPIDRLDGRTVALANNSRTSQVLARLVLENHYGVAPAYFESPPDLAEMFREADGALLIGDDALRIVASPCPYHVYDLGLEWKRMTGHSMVYALWAVRREFARQHPGEVSRVQEAFQASLAESITGIEAIARDIAQWEPFSETFLRQYFNTLQFDFKPDLQQGLLHFYELACTMGVLQGVPELTFWNRTNTERYS